MNTTILVTGLALAGINNYRLGRKYYGYYNTHRLHAFFLDFSFLGVATAISFCLIFFMSQSHIKTVKKELVINFENDFMKHMKFMNNHYKIPYNQQVAKLLNKKEKEEWESKKYMHLE